MEVVSVVLRLAFGFGFLAYSEVSRREIHRCAEVTVFKNKSAWFFVLLLAGLSFYYFGKSAWRPVWVKLTGAKSVEQAVTEIRFDRPFAFDSGKWSELVLLGLKEERMLEVWGRLKSGELELIKRYPITGFSGGPGPKLREGDGQIPEGIYAIEYLNPNSQFHLSMKLNYPNAFDKAKGKADGRDLLGFDIFIHGGSATIGCIPIGDAGIEEVFLMVSEVGINNVTAIVSPYDMRTNTKRIEIPGIIWKQELYDLIGAEFVGHFGAKN